MPMRDNFVRTVHMQPRSKQFRLDGDTYAMVVDLGWRTFSHWTIRLHNYSCPERGQPGGTDAWKYAHDLLSAPGQHIAIMSYKDELSYRRWVADIWLNDILLGEILVQQGHATLTPFRMNAAGIYEPQNTKG